ncbi:MAG: glycosyltransferase [Pyrobaculum sp.]
MSVAFVTYAGAGVGGGLWRARLAISAYRRAGLSVRLVPPLSGGPAPGCGADVYLSYHESYDALLKALAGALACGGRAAALLQGMPFYARRERREAILRALSLFEQFAGGLGGRYLAARRAVVLRPRHPFRDVFRLFHLVIHVSPAIPAETGLGGVVLDPGVSLPAAEMKAAARARIQTGGRRHALYVGRAVPEKGIVEAVLAYAKAGARLGRRLVIASPPGFGVEAALRAAKRLGVGDKVAHVPAADRWELYRLYASARVVLYPSHDDSYSLVVYEALLAGAPVAAYSIPALELNFARRGAAGLALAPEGDLDQLAEAAAQLAAGGVETAPPHLVPLEKILEVEAAAVKKLINS